MMQIHWIHLSWYCKTDTGPLSRYIAGMYFITYQLIFPIVRNLYIFNRKVGFFVTCSSRKYFTIASR